MSKASTIVGQIAVAFAAILLLSLGLCGVAAALNGDSGTDTAMGIGFFGFLLGLGGLVLTGLVATVVALVNTVRGRTPPPPPPVE